MYGKPKSLEKYSSLLENREFEKIARKVKGERSLTSECLLCSHKENYVARRAS